MATNYRSTVGRKQRSRTAASRVATREQPASIRPLPPVAWAANVPDQVWEDVGRTLKLSGRELQIVRGMFSDKIQYAIAADLGISPHTVHTHIERLYHKLEVTNRSQLLVSIMTVFVTLAASARVTPPARPTV